MSARQETLYQHSLELQRFFFLPLFIPLTLSLIIELINFIFTLSLWPTISLQSHPGNQDCGPEAQYIKCWNSKVAEECIAPLPLKAAHVSLLA